MPLTRACVTIASRIMLPTHAIFSAALGIVWVLQDPDRTNTAVMAVLRYWPIASTGAVLCVLAGTIVLGMLSKKRTPAAVALGAGMIVYAVIAVLFLVAAFTRHASWSAFIWPAYVATAHLASMLSLANDEVTDARGNHTQVTT